MKLRGRTSTSPRYETDITGPDPLSLVDLGRGSNSEKLEKLGICNLQTDDQILNKI